MCVMYCLWVSSSGEGRYPYRADSRGARWGDNQFGGNAFGRRRLGWRGTRQALMYDDDEGNDDGGADGDADADDADDGDNA